MEISHHELKYAYFPGCASKQLTGEYDRSTRLACEKLGIKLIDIREFSCCGAGVLKEKNKDFSLVLNARNLAMAEEKNLDIMTICSTCVVNLRKDLIELKSSNELRKKNNEHLKRLKLEFKGKNDVKHLLWVLEKDYGFEKIKKLLIRPLTGLKIACYYGCHIVRPSSVNGQYQESENPDNFENFIKSLGGIPVNLTNKTDCCGFHINFTDKKSSALISGKYLGSVKDSKADLIVTNCPFCHIQMDLYQSESEKAYRRKFKIPVIHMSQLLCLALGIRPSELGFSRHIVRLPGRILSKFK